MYIAGGDWALDRIGAIFLQGTENVVMDSCMFDRLDGNGVFVSGYNRNTTVQDSDFSYIGGNQNLRPAFGIFILFTTIIV